jgi:thioredoxin 1
MLTVKYFTASWCGPCKMFGPVFDQVMNETGVQHLKIDVDQKKDLTMSHMVSSVPTIIFEVGGSVVHRQTGAMSRGQLLDIINRFS